MYANSLARLVALLAIALAPHIAVVVYASPNSDEQQAEALKNLTLSVYENDAQGVAKALSDGANPNSSYTVQLPLEVAALRKNSEIVELLLKAGADPNLRKRYDPDESIFSGAFIHVPDFSIVELMIKHSGTKLDGSALFLGRQVHFFFIKHDRTDLLESYFKAAVRFDLRSRYGEATALIAAVEASNEQAVDILIATGADLAMEARDMLHLNALDHAVVAGDIALTEKLLLASDRWDLNERGNTATFTGLSSTFERALASKNKALIETVLRLGRKIDFTQKHPWTGRPILERIDDEAILELVMQYAGEAE